MECGEFKELSSAWALGALDQAEDAACAAHLASPVAHEGCQDFHREACKLTKQLAGAVTEHPLAPRVWRAIEKRVRAEQRAPIFPAEAGAVRQPRPRHRAPA